MYFNNETVLYLDGKFVKATESTTDLYGQTLHMVMVLLKVSVLMKQNTEPRFLKPKNITNA